MSELDSQGWPKPSRTTRLLSWLLNPGGAPRPSRLHRAVAGKSVLITGASYGIGAACAQLFGAAGARVLLVARSREPLEEIAGRIRALGGVADVYPADLTDPDSVDALSRRILASHGTIDVVVSNAGKSIRRSISLQYDRFQDYTRTVGVNYLGPVRLLLALLPAMRARGSGHLINVSSFAVRVAPVPRWGAYQASKCAFDMWFRSLRIEASADGVTTTSIYLPLVYTRMSAPTPNLRGLPGLYPEEAAGLVARAIVRRPRTIAPWWLWPLEVSSVVFSRPIEWILRRYFRRSHDSPGAIGSRAPVSAPASGGVEARAAAQSLPARKPTLRRALRAAGLMTRNPRMLAKMARAILFEGGRPSSLCALAAAREPAQPAVIDDSGTLTYAELHSRIERLAIALRVRAAVGPERDLAIMCRNSSKFIESLLAGTALGADTILLNTEFPGPQLAQVLERHHPACIIHDPEFASAIEQSNYSGVRVLSTRDAGAPSIDDWIDSAAGPLKVARRQGQIVVLTSGTTGIPKGAARTPGYRALSGPLITLLTRTPLRARTSVLISTPLFHGFGLAYLALSLLLGATMVIRRKVAPEELLADLARHRVEVVIAVPTLLARLLEIPESRRTAYDLSSLKAVLSSGAALSGDLAGRFMKAFGPRLYNLYGSSETGFGAIAAPADLADAPGTVGYPPVGTSIRILDDRGEQLPAGRVGRVFLRTGLVFAGYVGGGGKEIVDHHMNTGDLGHLDAAGRLFIDGRADDMIVSGGEKVFPQEIEELLAAHPDVAEAAAIGVPDEQFGRRLRAFVVVLPGRLLEEAVLRSYLKERVARFKIPRDFRFLTQLPRNAVGKVVKRDLDST